MQDFNELRYPFYSLLDFVRGGYFAERAGMHLTIAIVVFCLLSAHVLFGRGSLAQKLITLFFAGTVYNNPAFSIAGVHFNEMAGVLAVLWIGILMLDGMTLDVRRVGIPIMVGGLLMLSHAAFVSAFDPVVMPNEETGILRGMLVARIFVLGVIVLGIESIFTTSADFEALMEAMVRFGVAAILIYFFQAGIFLSGTTPYGTYWDAGFTGIPSFGAVSIERGHFGKFLILLFPFFAWQVARRRRFLPMMLFLLATLVNFSASSMSFLAGYVLLSALLLRRYLVRPAAMKYAVPIVAVAIGLGIKFGEQYRAVMQKVVDLGVKGDQGGGRGFSVLDAYLSAHPLGVGYSGSTLRNVGTLPEINMGAYALASQLSFLVLPVFAGFLWLNYKVIRESRTVQDPLVAGLLVSGIVMAVLIDLVDVLWFVPTIWAPLVICNGLAYARRVGAAEVGAESPVGRVPPPALATR
jgi:hypothetical protein